MKRLLIAAIFLFAGWQAKHNPVKENLPNEWFKDAKLGIFIRESILCTVWTRAGFPQQKIPYAVYMKQLNGLPLKITTRCWRN